MNARAHLVHGKHLAAPVIREGMSKPAKPPVSFNGPTNTTKTGITLGKGRGAPRLTKKTREAIDLLATTGRTQRDVAEIVGMNEKSLSKALAKPHVRAELERKKALAAIELDHMEGMAKREAIEVGLTLMRESSSDAVKARMVELFTGGKGNGVTVNVNTTMNSKGYEYPHEGGQVVELRPPARDVTPKPPRIGPDDGSTD